MRPCLLCLCLLLGTAAAQAQPTYTLKRQLPPGHRPAGLLARNPPTADALDLNEDGTTDLSLLQDDDAGNLVALEVRDGKTLEVLASVAYEPVWNGSRQRLGGIVGDAPVPHPMDFDAAYGRAAPDTPESLAALTLLEMRAVPARRHYANRVADDADGLSLQGFFHLDGDGLKEIVVAGEGVIILDNVGQIVFSLGHTYLYLGLLDAEGDGIPEFVVFDTEARRVQFWGSS